MRQRTSLLLIIPILAVLLAALACNMPGAAPAPDLAQVVAQTQTALASGQQTPGTPGAAPLLTPGTPGTPATAASPGAPTGAAPTGAAATPQAPNPLQPTQLAETSCTNLARFVTETVPDGTRVPPNAPFIKTWTLQNVGTCTWSAEYSLVFVRGEQMGGTSPQPLGQAVPPNGSLQVFLPQTAPSEPGEHQGFWMLQNARAQAFGLGDDGSKPFWVKVMVAPGAAAPTPPGGGPTAAAPAAPSIPGNVLNLGPATRTWTFDDNKAPFYLGEDADIAFDVDDGEMILTAFEPAGDQWRVAEQSFIDNFALEAHFSTGSECAGKDDYGLLVRAPRQADGIIDTGYVFGFNCDGQYRVYRMDSGSYNALTNWTPNPAIRRGPNQDNVMTVVGSGERMQIYANGTLLFEFVDASYPNGLFGLLIGSGGTQDFEVYVDQIAWWDLP